MFDLKATENNARLGQLKTAHGIVDTPSFMAVGTKGAVKLITTSELEDMGAQAMISNAFILYLRPGLEVIKAHGGLHKFMHWHNTSFTDCGGFQVLSLGEEMNNKDNFLLGKSINGIKFKSPFDGTKHLLNPETVMEIEHALGSDVAMALDDMPLYGCTYDQAVESLKNTHTWMKDCKRIHDDKYSEKQLLFGIAQGSVFPDLRLKSIKYIDSLDFDGIAFGGLCIGEPKEKMHEMVKLSTENCSKEKPRYLMGVGSPEDLLECISLGVDIFDSVFPTRNARHGYLFTSKGDIKDITKAQYREDYTPLDENCKCDVCKKHTKSYMHHLFKTKEPLGLRLASYHNLFFIQDLLKSVRKAISNNEFTDFKKDFLINYKQT